MEKDNIWLFKEIVNFLEFTLKDRKRFSNIKGKDLAHALMLVWGYYLRIEQLKDRKTQCKTKHKTSK